MNENKTFSTTSLKKIALISYFTLLVYLPSWLLYLSPSTLTPALVICMFVVPLLIPIRGLLKGNPYTYAWTNFILMLYFMHSLTTLWVVETDTIFALIEFLLTTVMFLACTYYAKYRGQELGLSIRKKKD